ncbi:hypothetical protein D9756_006897 [Leucocoprinus leucothites]|uniref:Uncharacterized protein n=1 Tax=Leucocoprinus leucothites TaxID=201217 RepID=A0A8H5D5K4_9AGAR|nr:hypothetical protein D9756_006897 [Leucoagaricus leucothites]
MTATKAYLAAQVSKSENAIQPEKSATSIVSRGSGLTRPGKSLKTPIRRFFFRFEALKPSAASTGNKRSHVNEHDMDSGFITDPLVNTPPLSSDVATSPMSELDTPDAGQYTYDMVSPDQQHTPPVPCMALQSSDHSVDAVVINTLLKLPFCCHEDLLTMPPDRIIEVAQEMNGRLPDALKINLNEPRDHSDIRREVERLVGIVKSIDAVSVPGAPLKRTKSRGRQEFGKATNVEFLAHLDLRAISPPTSPLAMISEARLRRRVGHADIAAIMSPTKLAMLREEDEEEGDEVERHDMLGACSETDVDEDVFRAAKKRRTSVSSAEFEMITPTVRRIKAPLMLTRLYDNINDASPTQRRTMRALSRRGLMFNHEPTASSPDTGKVIVKTAIIDRSLANTRARYRSSSKFTRIQDVPQIGLSDGPLYISTPKLDRIKRHDQPFRMSIASPIRGTRRMSFGKAITASPDSGGTGITRIPRYGRDERGSRSAFTRMSDFMLVDVDGHKEGDTNKTL